MKLNIFCLLFRNSGVNMRYRYQTVFVRLGIYENCCKTHWLSWIPKKNNGNNNDNWKNSRRKKNSFRKKRQKRQKCSKKTPTQFANNRIVNATDMNWTQSQRKQNCRSFELNAWWKENGAICVRLNCTASNVFVVFVSLLQFLNSISITLIKWCETFILCLCSGLQHACIAPPDSTPILYCAYGYA